ncbi:uncharacterized protein B0P05DRAFT_524648 [Gilbertella persicaria]|uniref:BZIP domain-containing protein n=1 Tax=Rhizopus stolonifer TaxID=4846 RepID=A0A367KKF1_RHIST|nr:uncharacterized protein B0P05DRAFT_524648 [Gilbertella persicaria]KAI8095090.1 hypothetical protein B0P05DRAFT_524648 [Gilbertella persicaria]RCI02713.1 hypothetical protein CU098_010564 [Rhizopus stolonifer]
MTVENEPSSFLDLAGFQKDDEQNNMPCATELRSQVAITHLSIPQDVLRQLQELFTISPLPNSASVSPSLLLQKPKHLTADERHQRRLWRNRLAAKECRKKKKEYIVQLENTVTRLQSENTSLRKQAEDLRQKVAVMNPSDDNVRLIKEVELLNTGLGLM